MVAHIIRSFADCERAMQASQDLVESCYVADLAMGLIVTTEEDERALLRIQSRFLKIAARSPNSLLVHSVFRRVFCPEQNIFERFRNILLPIFENALDQYGNKQQAIAEVIGYLTKPEILKYDSFYFTPQFSIKLEEHLEFNRLHALLAQVHTLARQNQRLAGIFALQAITSLYALPSDLQQWFDLIAIKFQERQPRAAAPL